MTIAADPLPADSLHKRRVSRLARQARVGILRNPNEPPRPPSRKTSLTGRWLSLRSSRRPPAQQVVDAALAVTQQPDAGGDAASLPLAALRHDESGRLAGIDVAGLMASVHGLGTSKPIRTSYGADMRPDLPPAATAPPRTRRKASTTDSEVSEVARAVAAPPATSAPAPAASPAAAPRRRRSMLLPVLGGIVLALVALVVVPAVMSL